MYFQTIQRSTRIVGLTQSLRVMTLGQGFIVDSTQYLKIIEDACNHTGEGRPAFELYTRFMSTSDSESNMVRMVAEALQHLGGTHTQVLPSDYPAFIIECNKKGEYSLSELDLSLLGNREVVTFDGSCAWIRTPEESKKFNSNHRGENTWVEVEGEGVCVTTRLSTSLVYINGKLETLLMKQWGDGEWFSNTWTDSPKGTWKTRMNERVKASVQKRLNNQ